MCIRVNNACREVEGRRFIKLRCSTAQWKVRSSGFVGFKILRSANRQILRRALFASWVYKTICTVAIEAHLFPETKNPKKLCQKLHFFYLIYSCPFWRFLGWDFVSENELLSWNRLLFLFCLLFPCTVRVWIVTCCKLYIHTYVDYLL